MSLLTDVKITISGAGCTIHHEIYPIVELFKSKGYEVELIDAHAPDKSTTDVGFDCYGKPIIKKITVIAEHLPWGG